MDFDDEPTTSYRAPAPAAAAVSTRHTPPGGAALGRITLVRASAVAAARHAEPPIRTIGFKR